MRLKAHTSNTFATGSGISTGFPKTMDQFILLGDSITQHAYSLDQDRGYLGPALSSAYVRKLDIVNRGFSGYNTRQALKLLPHIIPSPDQVTLRFLTIWFGANDARLPHTPGGPDQHVPIKEFKENLRAIATHECVRAHEDVRIILITPPPVEERKLIEADGSLRRTAHITATYARQVIELGKELNVPVINLWEQLVVRAGWSTKLVDETAFPGSEKAAKNDVR